MHHVYVLAVLFPVAVSLLLIWFIEAEHPAAANPIQVVVSGDPGAPSGVFIAKVIEFAVNESVAVALSSSAVGDPSQRVLYLEAPEGSGLEDWVSAGYPPSLFAPKTSVMPLADIGAQSAAGHYLVYGEASEADRFASLARVQGYAAEVQNVTPVAMLLFKTSLLYSVVACCLLAATALIAAAFARARRYAIIRFWGNSAGTIALRELAAVVRQSWKTILMLGLLAIAGLAWGGGLSAIARVSEVSAPFIAVMLIYLILVHVFAISVTYYLPDTLAAMRGRVQHLPIMSLTFCIRVPVALLLAATVGSVMGGFANVKSVGDVLDGLGAAGTAQRLAISGRAAADGDGQVAIFLGLGGWLRETAVAGEAIISQPLLIESGDSTAAGLIVNRTYLAKHPASLASGQEFLPPTSDHGLITVGIPEARQGDRGWLTQAVRSFLELNADGDLFRGVSTNVVSLADKQKWFTYGAQEFSSIEDSVTIADPVVIVVEDRVLSPSFYASMAGQGGYLFTDPARAITAVQANAQIRKYVRWIQPPAKPYLKKYRDAVSEFIASSTALVFLVVSLVGTSFGISLVYRTEQAQRTLVRRIYGWSMWRICSRAFFWEVVLYAVLVSPFLAVVRDSIAGAGDPVRASQTARALAGQAFSIALTVVISGVSLVLPLLSVCSAMERSRLS